MALWRLDDRPLLREALHPAEVRAGFACGTELWSRERPRCRIVFQLASRAGGFERRGRGSFALLLAQVLGMTGFVFGQLLLRDANKNEARVHAETKRLREGDLAGAEGAWRALRDAGAARPDNAFRPAPVEGEFGVTLVAIAVDPSEWTVAVGRR